MDNFIESEAIAINKIYPLYLKKVIKLTPPTEHDARGESERVLDALCTEFGNVNMSYGAMRELNPLCEMSDWQISVALTKNTCGWEVIRVEKPEKASECCVLAVDYGSTTITMELCDTMKNTVLASATVNNPQIKYGDEILSRIFYTKDNPSHLRELQELSLGALHELIGLIEEKSGINAREYLGMAIGGNTTMVHLLLGLFPWGIFHTPYAPVATGFGTIRAVDMGFSLPGYIYLVPAGANYLGGDILSGLLLTEMEKSDGVSVFLDIGTNGELVIGNRDFIIAGAGAAGPALESGVSKYGMRAESGAINHVAIDGDEIKLTTIGDAPPRGICGSGIVELIAEMFLSGWIDSAGKLVAGKNARILEVEGENGAEPAVCYAFAAESYSGADLTFAQSDISRFIQAKAAAHTMVASLLGYVGINASDISRFYLAGAFGTYADLESAITIGLYPDLPRDVFVPLGNASLAGARKLLSDSEQLSRIEYFCDNISYVQFGEVTDFVENMRAAEFLPHTQQQNYPSVMQKLRERQAKNAEKEKHNGENIF